MNTTKITTIWYVNKAFILSCFKIIKAHIVDDDCNEWILDSTR